MSTLATLRCQILELVPWDHYVPASDVVRSLEVYPAPAVWAQIVMLATEGIITTENPGRYDGCAMVRRAQGAGT
jgi:hypothetical protein